MQVRFPLLAGRHVAREADEFHRRLSHDVGRIASALQQNPAFGAVVDTADPELDPAVVGPLGSRRTTQFVVDTLDIRGIDRLPEHLC